MRKVLFIVNPASAGGRTLARWNAIRPKVERAHFEFDVKLTKSRGYGVMLAEEAVESREYDVVVSVGGDGTANEIINGLMASQASSEQRPLFTIFPSGTGSDSVRTLGISQDIDSFLRMVETHAPKWIDIGKVRFVSDTQKCSRYFLNACDVGMGAAVAQAVNSMNQDSAKKSGKSKYFRSILKQVFKFKPFDGTYVVGDQHDELRQTVIVAICNGMFFGGGVKVSPASKMDDGVLELVATDQISKWGLLGLVSKIYTGSHVGHPKIQFQRAKTFEIKLKQPQLLETDGEIQGAVTDIEFSVVPCGVKVLC